MISKDQMFPLLIEATPGFEPQWQEFLNEWQDEPVDLPHYICLANFASYLIGLLQVGETADFAKVFAVVEKLILEGQPYVSEAIVVGLLEDLQNTNLHETTKPEDFRQFLLPRSAKWWDKVINFWEKGILLSDN